MWANFGRGQGKFNYVIFAIILYFLIKCSFLALNVSSQVPPDEKAHLGLIKIFYESSNWILDPDDYAISAISVLSQDKFLYHLIIGKFLSPLTILFPDLYFYRFVNILLGLLNILVFWKLAHQVLKTPFEQVIALVIFTNVLMFTFLSSSVNYDNLVNLLATLFFLNLLLFDKNKSIVQLLWIVTIISLGILVKPSIFPLIPIAVITIALSLKKGYKSFINENILLIKKSSKIKLVMALALVSIVLSSSVMIKNKIAYNKSYNLGCAQIYSPEECLKNHANYKVYTSLKEQNMHKPRLGSADYVDRWVDVALLRTFGIFGHRKMTLDSWEYGLLKLMLILGVLLLNYSKLPRHIWIMIGSSSFYVGVVLFYLNYRGYLNHGQLEAGVQGRYLFPVLAPMVLVFTYSLSMFFTHLITKRFILILAGCFFIYLDFPAYLMDPNRYLFEPETTHMTYSYDVEMGTQKGSLIHVDTYNDVVLESQNQVISIKKNTTKHTFRGWAVDNLNGDQADVLLFKLNQGKFKIATYGLIRNDVARALRNPKTKKSGFEITLSQEEFTQGKNELHLYMKPKSADQFFVKARVIHLEY